MNMMMTSKQFETGMPVRKTAGTAVGELAYFVQGSGRETIVLWPSIFTDHHIYDGLVSRLGDRFRFILIDGPGHGSSGGTGLPYSMEDFGTAMLQVMDAAGIERAIIGGTSWGGIAGAMATLQSPDRVKGLLLMNTPLAIDENRPSLSSRMIAFGARWMLGTQLFRDGVAKSFFLPQMRQSNDRYMAHFHEMLKRADRRQLANAVRSVILRGKPLIERLPEIQVPTLLIAGKQDHMYPLKLQAEAALRLANGRFEAVESGHISVVDATDDVADRLSQFIESGELS